ncbi:hypothetical protein OsI_08478 [Oryza sativa Indica Group]|uniref:Uncharacterized protein n=1 Tax=Oryza sativa subsp. indica TaxID=39946 RepID=B8AGQ1_ORYSI|nr:hypothetical protein OsI_08478 [Oryza sativa Indica Group]
MKAAAATGGGGKETLAATLLRYLIILIVPFTVLYILYTLHAILSSTPSCPPDRPIVTSSVSLSQLSTTRNHTPSSSSLSTPPPAPVSMAATTLQHVVFGIAASARLWEKRKDYIKIWWRPNAGMRGFVWMDQPVRESGVPDGLPPIKISSNTSGFPYKNRRGHRSAIRISRIVSETFRLGLSGVRWYVMGDDDTVFLPDNLVAVLQKLDHRQPYYIGYPSESHLQNIFFSYGMAFGGGGFAISQPLAARLERMQDACIHRYPSLYGSDDRIHACMAELGVPLTRHPGFHQYDVYWRPPRPPRRPPGGAARVAAPPRRGAAALPQRAVAAGGFAEAVRRAGGAGLGGGRAAVDMLRRAQPVDGVRVVGVRGDGVEGHDLGAGDGAAGADIFELIADPDALLDTVVVLKKPDPGLWNRSPMRNCCRVLSSPKGQEGNKTMTIDVGVCKDWEFSQV